MLTIVLAIVTRRVVVSLLLGIATAVALMLPSPALAQLTQGAAFSWPSYLGQLPVAFVHSLTEGQLWPSLADEDHLRVFAFTILLGMQVALIHRVGGMLGIVAWAAPLAKSRRGGQCLTWLLGMVIFIDDYANTLLLGSTMRPLTDRLRISREKLAYLVDSTAAPVSGLALVSTWVATEISTMEAGYLNAGIDIGAETFGIFIQTIPSRFYILYALIFVLLSAWLLRDFGPMLAAERAAQTTPPPPPLAAETVTEVPPRAINAILPICVTVGVVVWLLILTGLESMGSGEVVQPTLSSWGSVIGQGNSYLALVYGAGLGLLTVLGLALWQRDINAREIRLAMLEGFTHVLPALVILWLAWTLSQLTGDDQMRTGAYLAGHVSQFDLTAGWLPTIVFLLASGIAFSTGTSWGTMAIVMPIIIPLVHGLLAQQTGTVPAADHPVLVASIGSVLAGAIFGDHCSPISDTTILSSRSSSCDHIAHVRTQMPYALTVGLVSILMGTLPAGFGVSPWLLLPFGVLAMIVLLLLLGRQSEAGE